MKKKLKKDNWLKRVALGCFKHKIQKEKKSPMDYYVYPFGSPFMMRYFDGDRFSYNAS